jgi:hypothetical protein
MTDRKAKQRRLERAGFRYYAGGWLPEKNPAGPAFAAQVEAYADDIEALLSEPAKPRGRPATAA